MLFCEGETHRQAAERGLQEELGITATLAGPPIATLHKRQLLVPGQYIDNELVESFKLEGFSGQVTVALLFGPTHANLCALDRNIQNYSFLKQVERLVSGLPGAVLWLSATPDTIKVSACVWLLLSH